MTKRAKVFGIGRCTPLDRNQKVRLMLRAKTLSRRSRKSDFGKAYGPITAKFLDVLGALLWKFHNGPSGACFPSLEKIAQAAACSRSTAHLAIKALEAAGILSWVHRLRRVRDRDQAGAGWRWRLLRTSNGYRFHDPKAVDRHDESTKSDFRSRTNIQDLPLPESSQLFDALGRLGSAIASTATLKLQKGLR
jgi:AraC-like DNA-binding protein